MINFLFWNLGGQPLASAIAELSAERDVSVVVVAECEVPPSELCDEVSRRTGKRFIETNSLTKRTVLLTAAGNRTFREVYANANGRLSLRRSNLDGLEFGLALVHLKSNVWWNREDLSFEAVVVADELRREASRVGSEGTCVLGDFNLQPFDAGMIACNGFFGMPSRTSLDSEFRAVQGRTWQPMYNPFWSCLGDRSPGPPGTFFRRSSNNICFDWHMFDQAIFSHGMLPHIANAGEVIDRIGDKQLVTDSGRIAPGYSDHLPIFFALSDSRIALEEMK